MCPVHPNVQPGAVRVPRAARVPDDRHLDAAQQQAGRGEGGHVGERVDLEVRVGGAQADEAGEDEVVEGGVEVVRAARAQRVPRVPVFRVQALICRCCLRTF